MPCMAFQVHFVNMHTHEDKKRTQVATALNALNNRSSDNIAASWKAVIAATDSMKQPIFKLKHICKNA